MKKLVPKRLKEYFIHLLTSNATTPDVADGLAIGVFVAWLPIIGLHMYLALLLTRLFKKNSLVAIMAVWITNPLTAFPIFLFNLWVGDIFYVKQSVKFSQLYHTVRTFDFREILAAGKDILIPLWIGSVIVGLVVAWISQRLCLIYYDRLKEKFGSKFFN